MRQFGERGDTLVEVVMALGILSLVLVSSYALATGTFRLGRGAGDRTQAVNYLQQQAEVLRLYRDNTADWSTFQNAVSIYPGAASNDDTQYFCMKKMSSGWAPVVSTDAACTVDSTKIRISAKADDEPGRVPPRRYTFNLEARWSEGNKANVATLQTSLVDVHI